MKFNKSHYNLYNKSQKEITKQDYKGFSIRINT